MSEKLNRRDGALLAAALMAVALSMRAAMSCVGPLTSALREDLGLSSTVAGFLTTIPLVVFAITAPFAGRVAERANTRALLLGCLLLSAAGVLVRSWAGTPGLFIGTAMLGLATGTLNVVMPAWIRRQFSDRIGLMTGVYSSVMTVSSAVAAGVCQPLMRALGSWRASLASPVALYALAACALMLAWRRVTTRLPLPGGDASRARFGARQLAVALFSGLQSFLFFSMLAWYPSMAASLCPELTFTGALMLLMQLVSLFPALVVPTLAGRTRNKGTLACAGALGLGNGATLSLALMFIATQGNNAAETARISGQCQCVGYLVAALGPTLFGFVYDALGSWTPILAAMIALSALMAALGLYAAKGNAQN